MYASMFWNAAGFTPPSVRSQDGDARLASDGDRPARAAMMASMSVSVSVPLDDVLVVPDEEVVPVEEAVTVVPPPLAVVPPVDADVPDAAAVPVEDDELGFFITV